MLCICYTLNNSLISLEIYMFLCYYILPAFFYIEIHYRYRVGIGDCTSTILKTRGYGWCWFIYFNVSNSKLNLTILFYPAPLLFLLSVAKKTKIYSCQSLQVIYLEKCDWLLLNTVSFINNLVQTSSPLALYLINKLINYPDATLKFLSEDGQG